MGRIDKPQLRRMVEAGLKVADIAKIFDVSHNSVYAAMRRLGIPAKKLVGSPQDGQGISSDGHQDILGAAPPIDLEIAASGGIYATLAKIASHHGMTQVQALQKWHQIRRNAGLMAAVQAADEAEPNENKIRRTA